MNSNKQIVKEEAIHRLDIDNNFTQRYLKQFNYISNETIDVLTQNGFQNRESLLAIDFKEDFPTISDINLAQKCLLRKVLIQLKDSKELESNINDIKSSEKFGINSGNQLKTKNNSTQYSPTKRPKIHELGTESDLELLNTGITGRQSIQTNFKTEIKTEVKFDFEKHNAIDNNKRSLSQTNTSVAEDKEYSPQYSSTNKPVVYDIESEAEIESDSELPKSVNTGMNGRKSIWTQTTINSVDEIIKSLTEKLEMNEIFDIQTVQRLKELNCLINSLLHIFKWPISRLAIRMVFGTHMIDVGYGSQIHFTPKAIKIEKYNIEIPYIRMKELMYCNKPTLSAIFIKPTKESNDKIKNRMNSNKDFCSGFKLDINSKDSREHYIIIVLRKRFGENLILAMKLCPKLENKELKCNEIGLDEAKQRLECAQTPTTN